MHKKLADLAMAKKASLNQVCVDLLRSGLEAKSDAPVFASSLDDVSLQLQKAFGGKLCGLVLFGSYSEGSATTASDVDVLVVLENGQPIERKLYKWWDENVEWDESAVLNPHFVTCIERATDAGGLWLEVATTGRIIYEKNGAMSAIFKEIKGLIGAGQVRRYVSNGHSYWVWR